MFNAKVLIDCMPKVARFTPEQLKKTVDSLAVAFDKWGINTPIRQAAVLGNLAVESNQLQQLEEDSRYSFKRANQIWPMLFPDLATYTARTACPKDFFNYVYQNRGGNGPFNSNDGYRYRGRGWIQLTLKRQYVDADSALNLGLIDHPDRAAEPQVAADIACWYCATHGCLEAADKGPDNFKEVVRCINKGLVDLELRTKFFKSFLDALT